MQDILKMENLPLWLLLITAWGIILYRYVINKMNTRRNITIMGFIATIVTGIAAFTKVMDDVHSLKYKIDKTADANNELKQKMRYENEINREIKNSHPKSFNIKPSFTS
jgi:hypothetical protein